MKSRLICPSQVWFRWTLALVYGIYVGNSGHKSGAILLQALNIITFVPTLYCKLYLGVESHVFSREVIFSGLVNALALCVLIWIYIFTAAHEPQEVQLSALLRSAVVPDNIASPADSTLGDQDLVTSTEPAPLENGEEPEF